MTRQTINTGTGANSNDGDPLRTAFTKINSNFEELYTLIGSGTGNVIDVVGPLFNHTDHNNVTVTLDSVNDRIILDAQLSSVIKDIKGSVFADDSTLLVDAIDGKHYGEFVGDLKGTVVADDSTVIVDGVAGTVSAGALTGALPALDGSALTNLTIAVTGTYNGSSVTITDYVGIDNPYEAALPQYDSSVGGWTSLKFPLYQNTSDNDVAIFDTAQGGWVNSALKTIDGNSILGSGDIAVISVSTLKTIVAASIDFTDFKQRIAAL